MTRVKICGIARVEDALDAARAGADFIGMIFAPSPRRVAMPVAAEIATALAAEHPGIGRVGVFVNPSRGEIDDAVCKAQLTHVQVHGTAPSLDGFAPPWIAALALAGPADARSPGGNPWAILVEPKVDGLAGGTGRPFPWDWARPLAGTTRLFVAGGLDAGTVGPLLDVLTPFAVDASSRLEHAPGIKDAAKVRALIAAVRDHDQKENRAS